jgi:hypothetical protein
MSERQEMKEMRKTIKKLETQLEKYQILQMDYCEMMKLSDQRIEFQNMATDNLTKKILEIEDSCKRRIAVLELDVEHWKFINSKNIEKIEQLERMIQDASCQEKIIK